MKYITSHALSEIWGISQRRIVRLALEGRISGAKLCGKSWMFPENAQKPADGRTRAGMAERQAEEENFRYPIFEFKDEASFHPPLSAEEQALKAVVEAFHACRFDELGALLGDLPERAENRYIRIAAIYCGCMMGIACCDTKRFLDYYGKLKAELSEDFPYKAEMSEYAHEIDASLGAEAYYVEEFYRRPAYCYHESFLPRFCNLSALRLSLGSPVSPADLAAHEANCCFLEKTDNYFDLQTVHIYLACAYAIGGNGEACRHHLRRALQLAEQYEMLYPVAALQYYYMPGMLDDALQGFSAAFQSKVIRCSREVHDCFVRFMDTLQINSLYTLLLNDDYIYVVFAVHGLTNREIAEKMRVSIGTVSRRYSEIYTLLGVKNKEELVALYHSLSGSPADRK